MLKIIQNFDDYFCLQQIEKAAAIKYLKSGYQSNNWPVNHAETFSRHHANNLLWVALWNDIPVGFAIVDIFHESFHLEEIDVHPNYQGKKIGYSMMLSVINDAKRREMKNITLRTFLTTAWSIHLYEKCGFNIINEIPYYLVPHLKNEETMGLFLKDRCTMNLNLK